MREPARLMCDCGAASVVDLVSVVDAANDPELVELATDDALNTSECPHCGATMQAQRPVVILDAAQPVVYLLLGRSQRHEGIRALSNFFAELADAPQDGDLPGFVMRPSLVFGGAGLAAVMADAADDAPLEPEPEPEPEPVDFTETVEPPPPPPPEEIRPRRVVQGLSTNSFAKGSGTGLSARAGTTLATEATDETMGLDEDPAWAKAAYASVTTKPKVRALPRLDVPQDAIDAELEGTWTIYVDIDEEGRVTAVRMKGTVGFGIDEECIAKWRSTRWKPGLRDGEPIAVTNIPMKCTIKALD